MKAAIFYEKGRPLILGDAPTPVIGPYEVLVKVSACGICQSDIEYIDLGVPTFKKPPIILGHEAAGILSKVGEAVEGLKVGDPVVCGNLYSCGVCRNCRDGRDNICDDWMMLGNHVDGAYAQYVKVPGRNVFLLPPEIPPEEGCIIADAVSTPFHAVKDRSGIKAGDSVAVFGCGGLGLNCVQIAAAVGAHVIAVDIYESKLALARDLGASETVNARSEDQTAEIRQLSGGGVDVAFELIGRPETISGAYKALRRGGRLVVVGFSPKEATFRPGRLMVEELEIVGSVGSRSADYPRLIELIRMGKIRIKPLITGRFPLSGINEALEVVRKGEGIRTVVVP